MNMTAIWIDSAPVPPFVHVSGGASFREAEVSVTCDGTYVAYEVDASGFRWSWNESNMGRDGVDDYAPPYSSISGVLGVDAEELLYAVREAVQLASSLGWQSDDPDSFSDEEDAI